MSSALFHQAERQEREQFFRRLDYEWGKGLRQKTHPDRSPDFRIVTAPPPMAQWCVEQLWNNDGLFQWQRCYYGEFKRQAEAWLLAVKTLNPSVRMRLVCLIPRSKQTGVIDVPRTSELRQVSAQGAMFAPAKIQPKDQAPHSGLHFARGLFGKGIKPEPESEPELIPFAPACLCALCHPIQSSVTVEVPPSAPRALQYTLWGRLEAIW